MEAVEVTIFIVVVGVVICWFKRSRNPRTSRNTYGLANESRAQQRQSTPPPPPPQAFDSEDKLFSFGDYDVYQESADATDDPDANEVLGLLKQLVRDFREADDLDGFVETKEDLPLITVRFVNQKAGISVVSACAYDPNRSEVTVVGSGKKVPTENYAVAIAAMVWKYVEANHHDPRIRAIAKNLSQKMDQVLYEYRRINMP